jgi:hypothetical protein
MTLVELIPLTIGAAVAPINVILLLTFLAGERGLLRGIAFVAGAIAVRLIQGAIFGLLLGSSVEPGEEEAARTLTSTLVLVLGLLMLITAIRKVRKEEDPDEPPPRWRAIVASAGPLKSFGLGALAITIAGKQWIFTLGALGVIREANLDQSTGVTLFLIYVLSASLFLLAPIVALIIVPARSSNALASIGEWLESNNRTVVIVVTTVFGIYFLIKGITGLTG